ncbi:cytochrome c3 family protein [Desulforhopalus vacuolatus]|uniref:cytochrome c3 family protein n=1 Tax=Desulforhopalus vacuolatus TaxID=40414 RepID=UPI001964B70A|nr:cytochrome c3 family protein [Desulforhopalus vacuolatus]MBM9518785.1 cytochrome c3 family protein [Desulforhopalus vacuolatus]
MKKIMMIPLALVLFAVPAFAEGDTAAVKGNGGAVEQVAAQGENVGKAGVEEGEDSVKAKVSAALDKAGEAMESAKVKAGEAVDSTKAAISEAGDKAREAAGDMADAVSEATGRAKDAFSDAADSVGTAAGKAADAVVDAAGDASDAVVRAGSKAGTAVAGAAGEAVEGVKAAAAQLAGKKEAAPDIHAPEKPIVWTKPVPGAVFSHQVHTAGAGLDCDSCHDDLFVMEAGTAEQNEDFNMQSMYDGKFCGSCHNGETAFAANTRCTACHIGVLGVERMNKKDQ